jgi:hypothetical protein
MRIHLIFATLLLLPLPAVGQECAGEAWTESTLYLGRGLKDGGEVTDAQIQAFVDDTLVGQFPDGFTLLAARGHWRDGATGRPVDERSVAFVVVHPPGSAAEAALRRVADAYIARFDQSAVLRSSQPACVTFYEKQ